MVPQIVASTDFETVPDFEQLPALLGHDVPEDLAIEQLRDYLHEKEGKPYCPASGQPSLPIEHYFPPIPLHRILVQSLTLGKILYANQMEQAYELFHISSVHLADEQEILKTFVAWFSNIRPRLLTWNGRSFEIPLLKMRCLRHQVPMSNYFLVGDKYDNYDSRYQHTWHADLMDIMSGYSASRPFRLREATAAARLPGKIFGTGRDVFKLYREGKIQEIQDYCEMDSLEVFLLYVRWQLIKGVITFEGYEYSISTALKYLRASAKPHFTKFVDEWVRLDPHVASLNDKL